MSEDAEACPVAEVFFAYKRGMRQRWNRQTMSAAALPFVCINFLCFLDS